MTEIQDENHVEPASSQIVEPPKESAGTKIGEVSDFEKDNVSEVCINNEFNCEDMLFKLILFNLLESIILKFFLLFNIFSALFSIPLQITTSMYILLSSKANFFFILKLHETIPPNALIGSHASANL